MTHHMTGYSLLNTPAQQLPAVICAPLVLRMLLPPAHRWGATPLVLLLIISNMLGEFLPGLLGAHDPDGSAGLLFPRLEPVPPGTAFISSLLWGTGACLLCVPALRATLRRAGGVEPWSGP
jgi:hypothetical protein